MFYVSEMNQSVSTIKGKMMEIQETNQELLLAIRGLELPVKGNHFITRNEISFSICNWNFFGKFCTPSLKHFFTVFR